MDKQVSGVIAARSVHRRRLDRKLARLVVGTRDELTHLGGLMRSNRNFAFGLLALFAMAVVLSPAASAHHSRAHYGDQETTTTGNVVEYKWRNPHVFVVWEVKDPTGKTTQWLGEMASVTSMIADGMTKDSLKPGDRITVVAFPSKNPGSKEALIKKITKADGKVVVDNSRAANLRQP
jgi:flagellar biosynthesis/type III secretory pathway M-ring protein FliF/YscJ